MVTEVPTGLCCRCRSTRVEVAQQVLLAAGLPEQAAITLGCAEATELPIDSIIAREPIHDSVRDGVTHALGEEEARWLQTNGAASDATELLANVRSG